MHMADALLSPAVGVAFLAASGAGLAYSAKKLKDEGDDKKVPLMGVMGAFVFAAQMINFTIPGTGSSGHLGGGMLLAMILGPYAAFLTIASVLIVQALFFADGGILALGTNIWNLGFYPCVVGWIIYKAIARKNPTYFRLSMAAVVGVIIALEMGAFSVVIETLLSGKSELAFGEFSALMMGIHFPIALVEGIVTLVVVNFVYGIRPEVVKANLGIGDSYEKGSRSLKPVIAVILGLALFTGSVLALLASSYPDGLEWSLSKVVGEKEPPKPEFGVISELGKIQKKTAVFPDYDFKKNNLCGCANEGKSWLQIHIGTSVAGVAGSVIVLLLAGLLGMFLFIIRGKKPRADRGGRE